MFGAIQIVPWNWRVCIGKETNTHMMLAGVPVIRTAVFLLLLGSDEFLGRRGTYIPEGVLIRFSHQSTRRKRTRLRVGRTNLPKTTWMFF